MCVFRITRGRVCARICNIVDSVRVYVCMCVRVCVCMCVCVYVCMCVRVYVCMCVIYMCVDHITRVKCVRVYIV